MISIRDFFSPVWWISFLHRVRYLHFFAVGISGVGLNLAITVGLTELFFGREHYFSAYLIGLGANLIYNFVLHTVVTFKTEGNHALRLILFLGYSVGLAYLQTRVVRYLTDLIGVDWYVVVIGGVIMVFSALTFLLFKFILFRKFVVWGRETTHMPDKMDI